MSIAQVKAARRATKNNPRYRKALLRAEANRIHHGKNTKKVKR